MSGESAAVELSVIVPCYNEEDNLPELVERTERVFDRRRIRGEIVLVNDGSRDGTAAQIEALGERHPCVVGVHHPTNRGIPAGWKSGFEHSRGRYVCTIDADLQYQPEAIAHLYREMCFSKADLVQGWRSTLERQHDHRYYWSRGLDYLLKVAFAMPEYDVKSGFVLYRREVFEDILRESGRFHYFQHMITVVAKAKGYSVRQVETLFAERHAGQSFIGGFPLTMMSRTFVDIGRAFVDYRVREPKDQSLEAALAAHGGAVVAASRPRAAAGGWLRAPGISRNAPRYLEELRRTQWLPRAELEQLQLRRLRRLVAHAADHVGYWRELFETAGVTADDMRGARRPAPHPDPHQERAAREHLLRPGLRQQREAQDHQGHHQRQHGRAARRVPRSAAARPALGERHAAPRVGGLASGRAAPAARARTGRRVRRRRRGAVPAAARRPGSRSVARDAMPSTRASCACSRSGSSASIRCCSRPTPRCSAASRRSGATRPRRRGPAR